MINCNMTPQKLKAKQLVDRFDSLDTKDPFDESQDMFYHNSKQCALIVCDEVMKELKTYESAIHYTTFWETVKTEIENL